MILAIETSLKQGSIAVLANGNLLGSREIPIEFSMSKELLNEIDKLLNEIGINLSDLSLIGVSSGPGSLTGIRVGISVGMGLAFSQGIRCFGISLLEAMKQKSEREVCISIIPGGTGYSYYQIFKIGEKGRVEIIKNDEIPRFLSGFGEFDLFIEKRLLEKIELPIKYNFKIFPVSSLSELVAAETYDKLMNTELDDISASYGNSPFNYSKTI